MIVSIKNFYLYIVVFVSGAAVLAIEILGTRILGPFYGVSLFLWSALITATLIALSVGYAVGGRWADRGAKMSRLAYMMLGAGIWTLFIPWLKQPVLVVSEPFGLRFAVLVAAFILFVPPLTLLGMVSPYAIRVRAQSLNVVGRTAGDLYAISTVGSVISALLTGFILIPNIGVSRLTFMVGLILLAGAAPGLVSERKSKATQLAAVAIFLFSVILIWLAPTKPTLPSQGLVAVEQSPYAEIRVLDMNDRRHLLIDGGIHTIVDPKTWASHFPYTAVVDLTREFFGQPGEMLLIGLGGGTVVKNFAREGWTVDAVEIDPVVIEVAQKYFGLQESEGSIYSMDGRQFLITHAKKYDVIVMDAFGSSSIPFHLVTGESFGLIALHLNAKGILAMNVIAKGWNDPIIQSIAATLKLHFNEVCVLPVKANPNKIGNVVVFASDTRLEPAKQFSDAGQSPGAILNMKRAWAKRFVPETRSAPILTDDLNPVDFWSESINLATRKELHSYFEQLGLSW